VPIEQALGKHALVDMTMVIAEGHKFATCLIFPNLETVARMKKEQGMINATDEEFLKGKFVRKEIQELIGYVNEHLNHWEQLHDYRIITEPLTVQSGELTPSMKIRRAVVLKKYKALIDAMYAQYQEEAMI
jgi:long-chain acyl-CoA synthetase